MQKIKVLAILAIVVAVFTGIVLFFKWDIEVSSTKKHKVAIQGYDAVSYFKKGEAEPGGMNYDFFWNKLTWRFSSNEHLLLFQESPATYAPQFGGNCAFTTSIGKEQMGLGKHWQIIDSRLYLNSNIMAHFLWKLFPSLIPEAEEQWNLLIKKKEEAQAAELSENPDKN